MQFIQTHLVRNVSKHVLGIGIAVAVVGLGFFAFSAVNVSSASVFFEGFGSGSDEPNPANWENAGWEKHESGTIAKSPEISGNDSASPQGGRFAKIREDSNDGGSRDGYICREIDAEQFENLELSYYWRGDADSESSGPGRDRGVVEARNNGNGDANCNASGGWTSLQSHNLAIDSSWSTQSAFDISQFDETKFLLRFRNNSTANDEFFRVDGVEVTGDPLPQVGELRVCKVIDDGEGNYIDGSDVVGTDFTIEIDPENGDAFDVVFSTALGLNTNLFGDDDINDAQCIVYEDVPHGTYFYGEEEISGAHTDLWETPLYDELEIAGGFVEHGGPGANGDVIVSSNLPSRTIVVKNTLKPLAKVVATKIVCDDEQYLPDWNEQGIPVIDEDTIDLFFEEDVAREEHCEVVDWDFQWAPPSAQNPGDNVADGGDGWTTFANMAFVPLGEAWKHIWMREVPQEGFTQFTGVSDEDPVSSEFYCHIDSFHYDNFDRVDRVTAGETYYCVAFNATVPLDFGDAPDTYPTLLADDGARHALGGPVLRGVAGSPFVDAEDDGQPDAGAVGDDLDSHDDEEGVNFLTTLQEGENASIRIFGTSIGQGQGIEGILDAWIDWNADGDWDDPGEQIFDSLDLTVQPSSSGQVILSFAVPGSIAEGDETFARFRVSSAGGLEPTGFAPDGEVEDYYLILGDAYDFGDAPESYGTLLADDGARHFRDGFSLGTSNTDTELDGQPSSDALGDDNDGADDENGITYPTAKDKPGDSFGTLPLVQGTTVDILISGNTAGRLLDAWIDWDRDGVWSILTEQIFTSRPIVNGNEVVSITIPSDAQPGETYARFRASRDGGLTPTGFAPDGEVEDYRIFVTEGDDMQCEYDTVPGWADEVVDDEQGTKKNFSLITDPLRTDPTKTLGSADGLFYSLGRPVKDTGWIIVAFDGFLSDVEGDDLSIHERTNGRDSYPEETAQIEVSQDGITWEILSEHASSKKSEGGDGVTLLDISETGYSWIKYVRITDTTDYSIHNDSADGFDLDAVDAVAECVMPDDNEEGRGIIVVRKVVAEGSDQEEKFVFGASWLPTDSDFSLGHNDSATTTLSAGLYRVAEEDALPGWEDPVVSCDSSLGHTESHTGIDLNVGEVVICTFVNQEKGPPESTSSNDDGNISSGSFSGSFPSFGPQVAGATTECGLYLNDFLHIHRQNDRSEIIKLQAFLKFFMGYDVAITGVFDQATFDAVTRFQNEHSSDVLNPWTNTFAELDNAPTGYVYQTTRWKINNLVCPEIQEFPNPLIPDPGTTV